MTALTNPIPLKRISRRQRETQTPHRASCASISPSIIGMRCSWRSSRSRRPRFSGRSSIFSRTGFALVSVTVSRSLNIETLDQINRPDLLGPYFPYEFGARRDLFPGDRRACQTRPVARGNVARRRGIISFGWRPELLMAVPNVTFSIWGNLAAVTRLRRHEAADAWRLLQRIHEEGGRLSLAGLRQEIQDETILRHVVFSLQLVGLVDRARIRAGMVPVHAQSQRVCAHAARCGRVSSFAISSAALLRGKSRAG